MIEIDQSDGTMSHNENPSDQIFLILIETLFM